MEIKQDNTRNPVIFSVLSLLVLSLIITPSIISVNAQDNNVSNSNSSSNSQSISISNDSINPGNLVSSNGTLTLSHNSIPLHKENVVYYNETSGYLVYPENTTAQEGGANESLDKLNELAESIQNRETRFAGQKVPPVNLSIGRIKGEILHFILDVNGVELREVEGMICKLTGPDGHGGIRNPRFPWGAELEIAISRLVSTVKSDGQLRRNGKISYTETHQSRIDQVQRNLEVFGDIYLHCLDRGGKYELSFPAVLGQALMHLGMRTGLCRLLYLD